MRIVLLSKTCSERTYAKVFEERSRKFVDPSQKFFMLLLKGMLKVEQTEVMCISIIPVSGNCHSKKIWRKSRENEDGITYFYPGFINIGLLRLLTATLTTLWQGIKNVSGKDYILYDPTDISLSLAAVLLKKWKKVKTVALITDIPSLATVIGHRKQKGLKMWLQERYDVAADKFLQYGDGYILLTEQMNEAVNKYHKPYIVVEGSVDADMQSQERVTEKKDIPKSIMYAGGLHEKFGVLKLVQAFIDARIPNYELKLYGSGQAVEKIEEIAKSNPAVKYMGVVPVSEIEKQERKAVLLVNPRPTTEEFTKYSFPSKTLEYMASGTPLLTTRLPGIPEEYFDYTYTFEEETVEGMKNTLIKVLDNDEKRLQEKGMAGQRFVLQTKNNVKQAEKIVKFIDR